MSTSVDITFDPGDLVLGGGSSFYDIYVGHVLYRFLSISLRELADFKGLGFPNCVNLVLFDAFLVYIVLYVTFRI